MYIIGLTGNIATGKSTVAEMLRCLGATVIDADKLGHWVMRAGTPAHAAIVARFGAEVCDAEGQIDRRRLGAIVFADAAALSDLERIVHPEVVAETWRRLSLSCAQVGVVEAIKLLEASMSSSCDAIWVVHCRRQLQIERLMATRGLTRQESELRIDAQPPAEEKLAKADIVIYNEAGLEDTRMQVLRAWEQIPILKGEGTPASDPSETIGPAED